MDPDPLSCILTLISGANENLANAITLNTPSIGIYIAFLFAIIALCISAFISGSEIAFFSLSKNQIDEIEENNSSSPVIRLLEKPEKLLATILICNNLVNVAIVILCNYIMNNVLHFSSTLLSFVFQSVILTFLILLFGEIIPKLYATNHNLKFALFASPAINSLCVLFSPLSRIMEKSTFIVNKMVAAHGDEISKEDLTQALEFTKANDEKELLEGILKFGGTTVTEIMIPRVDIEDIEINTTFDKVVEIVINTGYSRLPVYEENPDNIKGILYAKDLLPYIGKASQDFNWQRLLRDAYYVPETRMIDDLLEDFRKKKIHIAIVVDEFGGTQGVVTLEDVLEEIVGDINDEYDTEEKSYKRISDNIYIFEGKTLLNDFFKITGIDEDEFGNIYEDAETIAGLLLEIKGDFPKIKDPIFYGGCEFIVLEIDKHRIASVKVKIMSKNDTNS